MFVSTEFGGEYHAYGFIGNTALPYALGLVPVDYEQHKKPMHRVHFSELTKNGIYVTPVTFIGNVQFKVERFNCIPESYELTWKDDPSKKGGRTDNYPDEGVFKMIARGNVGVFYIISEKPVAVPTYIRVGKFMSKCKIDARSVSPSTGNGKARAGIILRAEDIPPSIMLTEYEKMPVQHGMYLRNCMFNGPRVSIKPGISGIGEVNIPVNSAFYAALGGA